MDNIHEVLRTVPACGKHSINGSYNYPHDSQNQLTLLSCRLMYPHGAVGKDVLLKL